MMHKRICTTLNESERNRRLCIEKYLFYNICNYNLILHNNLNKYIKEKLN